MAEVDKAKTRDRIKAMAGVAAFHALLGYALIVGLGYDVATAVTDNLKVFDVREEPPPPIEEPIPAETRIEEPEGAASPPSMAAQPSPVVAPPPEVRLKVPPDIVTVPEPTPVAPGNDPSAGSAKIPGPGTGTGGQGSGTGAGGQGSGTGGGAARPAQRVGGAISGERDYPARARRARIEGSVAVRFVVGVDGRVSGCSIRRSSGNAELDRTTCRLIERRFRYVPAKDAQGRPVPETVSRTFDWLLPGRGAVPPS